MQDPGPKEKKQNQKTKMSYNVTSRLLLACKRAAETGVERHDTRVEEPEDLSKQHTQAARQAIPKVRVSRAEQKEAFRISTIETSAFSSSVSSFLSLSVVTPLSALTLPRPTWDTHPLLLFYSVDTVSLRSVCIATPNGVRISRVPSE